MKLRKPWQLRIAGRVGATTLRALGATWRGPHRGIEFAGPGFYVFLHAHILPAVHACRDRPSVAALISTHRDGELIARVCGHMGFELIRGSSTRGGARAALEIVRSCRDKTILVTPDGPRGPRGKVEPGFIQLAGLTGLPIRVMSFAASRARRLNSWDRFLIPKVFARIRGNLGEPIVVPKRVDAATAAHLAAELSRTMLEAELATERELSS